MIMQESSVHPGMGSSWMDDVQNDAFTMRRLDSSTAELQRIIIELLF